MGYRDWIRYGEGGTPMGGVAVLGTGAWGTTLAILVALDRERQARESPGKEKPAPEQVRLWEHRPERAEAMERERENTIYLPSHPFPTNLRVTSDLTEAVADCDLSCWSRRRSVCANTRAP
jgi:glycerol-3-phosphate dehydrogenase (NAD(P)+)